MRPETMLDDFAAYIGQPLDEDETKQATFMLDYAAELVASYTGQPWGETAMPPLAAKITVACAARAFMNPEGFTGEAVDDWRGDGRPVEEAGLYLTATEKRALDGLKPVAASPFRTVTTHRGDLDYLQPGTAVWIPTDSEPHTAMPIPW